MKRFFHSVFLLSIILMATSVNAATSLSYVYDANGNLISGDGKYYEYNDANQLVKVKHGDQNGPVVAEYVYDYTGQRIKKIDNGVTTYYIGKHFETQKDGLNTQNTSYYFANGERVAKKDALGNIAYYHSDHLGGTNVITDSGGNLVERIRYYPFGEIRESGNEKYSFTGKEKDKLTDYYYFEARYYNPDFKHFTQSDTIIQNLYDPQNLNRYSYVRNNPLRYIDPSGHVWWNPFTWFKKNSAQEKGPSNSEAQRTTNLATVELPKASSSVNPPPDTRKYIYQNYQVGKRGGQCTEYAKAITDHSGRLGVSYKEKTQLLDQSNNSFKRGDEAIRKGYLLVINEGPFGHVAVVVDVNKERGTLKITESNYHNDENVGYREEIPMVYGKIYGAYKTDLRESNP